MKKITKALFIATLALVFTGCGKKKDKTTNKTSSDTKTTVKPTTTKKTTTKTTTKDQSEVFNEITYAKFQELTGSLDTTNPYHKAIINGSVKEDNTLLYSFDNELLRKDLNGEFRAENLKSDSNFFTHDFVTHHGSTAKFYTNKNNEFKVVENILVSTNKEAKQEYIYDSKGFLKSIKTTDIKEFIGELDYDEKYVYNIDLEYSLTEVIDGYTKIDKATAQQIVNNHFSESNPNQYYSGILNSSVTYLGSQETTTYKDVILYYQHDSNTYYTKTASNAGMINSFKSNFLITLNNVFMYANEDNELKAIMYYKSEVEDEYSFISTIEIIYNEYGFASKIDENVHDTTGDLPEYPVNKINIKYLKEVPTYKVTLNAGLGKFSDNSKTKEIKVEPGTYFNNVQYVSGYEVPTLENASYASYEWFDENGKAVTPGDIVDRNMTITYGFIESDHKSSPMTVMYYDVTNSFKDNNTNSSTITINYDFNEEKTQGVRFQVGTDHYYTTNKTLTATFSSSSNPVILIYGTVKDICLSNSNGPLSYGNNYVTQFIINEPQNIVDYAFYNLKGLTGFIIGGSGIIDELGEHALDGCSKLSTIVLRPLVIKSYALANCGFNGFLYSPLLYNATTIEENVFAGCDNLTSISVLIEPKVATLEDESVVYYFDNDCFNVAKDGWVSNWNCGKQIKYEIEFKLSTLDQGVKIVVPKNTGDNLPRTVSFILGVETYSTTYDITLSANSTFNLKYASVELKDSDEIVGYAHYDSEEDRVITLENYAPKASPLEFTLYNPYENEYSTVISDETVYVTIKRTGSEM